jgi:hypothetical protein
LSLLEQVIVCYNRLSGHIWRRHKAVKRCFWPWFSPKALFSCVVLRVHLRKILTNSFFRFLFRIPKIATQFTNSFFNFKGAVVVYSAHPNNLFGPHEMTLFRFSPPVRVKGAEETNGRTGPVIQGRRAEQLSLRSQQRIVATVEDCWGRSGLTVEMNPGLLVSGRHFFPRQWALRSQ